MELQSDKMCAFNFTRLCKTFSKVAVLIYILTGIDVSILSAPSLTYIAPIFVNLFTNNVEHIFIFFHIVSLLFFFRNISCLFFVLFSFLFREYMKCPSLSLLLLLVPVSLSDVNIL